MSVAILRRALLTLSLFALAAAAIPARADDAVPQADREAIEAIIRKNIANLANEKDKDGIGYKRGTFSKSFKKVDASTYVVGFSRDTIENKIKPDTDQIKTERLDLTFKKGAAGWTLAKEDVKDTFVALWIAVRAALRSVLEHVTVADLAAGALPADVAALASDPDAWDDRRTSVD